MIYEFLLFFFGVNHSEALHILVEVFLYKNIRLAFPWTRSHGHQKHKIYNQLYFPMAGETQLRAGQLIGSLDYAVHS
jgi:hypothetical protein